MSFRYQLIPAAHSLALSAEAAGLTNKGNASLSEVKILYLNITSNAPHSPVAALKPDLGLTPV